MKTDKIFKTISAKTVKELNEKIKQFDGTTAIAFKDKQGSCNYGVYALTGNFKSEAKTFRDAFDHSEFTEQIFSLIETKPEDSRECLLISPTNKINDNICFTKLKTLNDIKILLNSISQDVGIISPDEDFEFGGCITSGVRFFVTENESKSSLTFLLDT